MADYPKSPEEARRVWQREREHNLERAQPAQPHTQPFPGEDRASSDIKRNNFMALVFCLMLGTAALPHILVRSYTTRSVPQARMSVFWALFFIMLLYTALPAMAVLVKFEIYNNLVGTDFMVIFGLTYNFIPFMTLPLYTSLERLDIRYIEAAGDLYASPAAVFRRVTLPLTMPGVISGTLLTFIPITGDYVNASRDFLGSPETSMIGNMVQADFLQNGDYPAASALSALLMAAILAIIAFYVRRTGTEDLL